MDSNNDDENVFDDSMGQDFAGEFASVRQLPSEQLTNDRFLQRLKSIRNETKETGEVKNGAGVDNNEARDGVLEETDKKFGAQQNKRSAEQNAAPVKAAKTLSPEGSNIESSHKRYDRIKNIPLRNSLKKHEKKAEMFNADDIGAIRDQVKSQLLGTFSNITEAPLLQEKYQEIRRLFEHTIRDSEGHSILIIGPRASGKTALINRALEEMKSKYSEQFLLFRLNAYIHSDDNAALREIARQLDKNSKKYLDQEIESMEDGGNFEQRSINDTLTNILSTLNDTAKGKLSLVFVIEEFEKFTGSSKQTLLYNLFDASQSSSTPICVVGVSSKINTRELLEKRVRSRFSQRIISIPKASTVAEFWDNAKLNLMVSDSFTNTLNRKSNGEAWNNHIDQLFDTSAFVRRMVYQNFYAVNNYREFNNALLYPVSRISPAQPFLNEGDFLKYLQNQSCNHVQELVKSLSTLELLLAIAAARWIEKFELQVINFNLAYKEYQDMMKGFNINVTSSSTTSSNLDAKILTNIKINQKIWSPHVLKNSWEILYKLGLLVDSAGITTNNEGHKITNLDLNKNLIIEENKMVQLDVSLDELGSLVGESHVFKKLTKL